ncbi:Clavaminate synthase-like protein [Cyathus striatus]|nr:Clavaminate synthase-like protein [Cyathus striatus]
MSQISYPAFPDDVSTHPLLVIDYKLIEAEDEKEIDRLWEAGTKLGFWYLKNHGVDEEANNMFQMGAETMALPLEEKMKFEQGDQGKSFGYKAAGANAVDATGRKDTVEFINIAKDDALSWPKIAHRTYPDPVQSKMETVVAPFVKKSLDVNNKLLEVLNDRLGLPAGALLQRHSDDEHSSSEARVIRNPANPPEAGQALGSHTDFGSLSFLHNRLGGLQVLVPGAETWQYIRPIPGHAICNIGDAVSIFSGGILRSNLHRVVPPPGEQRKFERWSLVFFTRPGDSVMLRPLTTESDVIAEAVSKHPKEQLDAGVTATEWFTRRIRNQRINNRKGPETWLASRGTEDNPSA